MAAHIIRKLWHVSEKQKVANRIIASSNCWAGINDLRPQLTRIHPRNMKKPDGNRTLSNEKNKEY